MGMLITGIGASEAIDSSGEILSIEGLDISSLEVSGTLNYDHKNDLPSHTVGKILKAKKIFRESDCENPSQLKFWNQIKVPYLWTLAELFDSVGHTEAMNIAAMLRYDSEAKESGKYTEDTANLINFSVEGAKLQKEGNIITKSIARKLSITINPCNKIAEAEIYNPEMDKKQANKPKSTLPSLSLIKNEVSVEIFEDGEPMAKMGQLIGHTRSGKPVHSHGKIGEYNGFSSEDHHDAADLHRQAGVAAINPALKQHHNEKMKLHTGAFSTNKNKELSRPQPKAAPAPTPQKPKYSKQAEHYGVNEPKPQKPTSEPTPPQQGVMGYSPQASSYGNLPPKKDGMKKGLDLGSSMGAPSTLTGGAALAKNPIDKKSIKPKLSLVKSEEVDDFKHHRLMAGYHEQRSKHHSKIASDFNSSSDPEVRAQSKVHFEKAHNHSKHSEEHLAEAHAHHEPAKHGPWNKTAPTEKESSEYGKKNQPGKGSFNLKKNEDPYADLIKSIEQDKAIEMLEKVQQFKEWLAKKAPGLSKKEVEAFTKAFALFKVKKAEKYLKDI
jgi:hypothetical protein